jgi:hypothetical protein
MTGTNKLCSFIPVTHRTLTKQIFGKIFVEGRDKAATPVNIIIQDSVPLASVQ